MGAARDKFDKRSLGRDPTYGRVAFRTGVILSRRNRLKSRNSKQARNALRNQLSGD